VHGSLILVQVFFGLHYLAAKVLLEEIPAPAWALIRVSCAAALLLLVVRLTGRRLSAAPADLARLALYSVFGVVINQLFFAEGMSRTSPTHASILMTSIPLATLLFAVILRRETLSGWKSIAFVVGLAGVVLVVGPAARDARTATTTGDLLILTNALSYSLFLVLSKGLMRRMDALAATALLLSFGALGMLIPGWSTLRALDVSAVSPSTWALGAFIVIFPTAAAYLMTVWALARVESSVVALFIYLQPVIASGLSIALLGDRVSSREVLGAALVFASVYFTLRPPGRRAAAPRRDRLTHRLE